MKRLEWVDALKGFGIFCVTLGHLSCHQLIETYIYSFHMFLFFFLSGFVRKDGENFVCKKTKSLLLPFLAWNTVSVFVGCLVTKDIAQSLRQLFLLDGEICWNSPIWFLLLLYMGELAYTFIKKFIPHGGHIMIPVLLALWALLPEKNVFLKLNILPVCLLFYILGNLCRPICEKHKKGWLDKDRYVLPACGILLGMSLLFGVVLNERISFTSPQFGNVLYCFIAGVAGVLFYVLLFQKCVFLSKSKVLSYLGRNSLIVMAVQYWFFNLYDRICARLGIGSIWYYRSTVKAVALSVGTIAVICFMAELMKKLGNRSAFVRKLCLCLGVR